MFYVRYPYLSARELRPRRRGGKPWIAPFLRADSKSPRATRRKSSAASAESQRA